jgi:hypothetical protein
MFFFGSPMDIPNRWWCHVISGKSRLSDKRVAGKALFHTQRGFSPLRKSAGCGSQKSNLLLDINMKHETYHQPKITL